ncbi:MAG: hypothetical protein ACLFNU_06410 [Bacteroidales bacterium]
MRTIWFIGALILCLGSTFVFGQKSMPSVSEMKWGRDFNLHVKLSNDTNYVMDVRALHHEEGLSFEPDEESTTFYPVSLDDEFIEHIKNRKLETENHEDTAVINLEPPRTLWSALHYSLGGSYVHFVNSLIYSLESQTLKLSDPIMKRPETNWKPRPRTKTYKRTRKWDYYIPYDQRQAQREYRKRKREDDLTDLQGVPQPFIDLFLKTSQKDYEELRATGKRMKLAQIDIVRLLLGAKYLGTDQIAYIQNRVTSAVLRYSVNNLPSVIIFDDYDAAVAMTLDKAGYKIDHVVFRDQEKISHNEKNLRIDKIEALLDAINEANDKVFQKRLSTYYGS